MGEKMAEITDSKNLLSQIKSKNILVIGDLMVDSYIKGSADRLSPEAPVPVLTNGFEKIVLGGAANVVANLYSGNQNVFVASVIGKDDKGDELLRRFQQMGVHCESVCRSSNRKTTNKIRFLSQNDQQIMRYDIENTDPITPDEENELLQLVSSVIKNVDLIIFSDYMKGVLTLSFCQRVIDLARKKGIKVLVDVKDPKIEKYKGAFLLKPNLKELGSLTKRTIKTFEDIKAASLWLCKTLSVPYILTTLGGEGMVLVKEDGTSVKIPAYKKEVFDVSGAGDTVVAYLGICIANGFSFENALDIANVAAGIQVSKKGTAMVYLSEIWREKNNSEIGFSKLISAEDFDSFRQKGKKIVFTNGCFDIIHAGHVSYLQKAKLLGDILVIGLNSDASVRRLKGPSRPINCEQDRAIVLSSLKCVDYIVIFGEDTPLELIKKIKPDFLVKGADYNVNDVVGKDFVESYGGKVVLLPYVEGESTTGIINKILEKSGK